MREKMEIGSVYELNPHLMKRPAGIEKITQDSGGLQLKYVERFQKKHTVYTESGRQSITLAIQSLEEKNPNLEKKVLLPTYMCDSVFIPFQRNGWEIFFYHIDRKMKASFSELEALIQKKKPSLLFIHSYYGMDTWKGFETFLRGQQQSGLIIMEDLTQDYYRELRENFEADYLIGSLRKWYFIPDGGFVTTDAVLNERALQSDSCFARERTGIMTDKWKYLGEVKKENWENFQGLKKSYLRKHRKLERFLDEKDTVSPLSPISIQLLKQAEEDKDCEKRKLNYTNLYRGLEKIAGEEISLLKLGDVVAPLYFPVYVKDRENYQRFLQKNDVFAAVLWPIGEENREVLGEEERYIYRHLLALPLDQRYGEKEMRKIVKLTEQYLD